MLICAVLCFAGPRKRCVSTSSIEQGCQHQEGLNKVVCRVEPIADCLIVCLPYRLATCIAGLPDGLKLCMPG
ncbi:unnamed protein product [Protopolystoma xenopodis]|uniref:Uncharacterized protein n=1 Tax=Protopolystoma xenopodis TaxID=117903 RepID=A0A3S5ADZ2_9PLAT|nr:unnamed protein product [Protopolystoma xenopodis]